jgi:cytochrome oxidase assembly protein ShyY1
MTAGSAAKPASLVSLRMLGIHLVAVCLLAAMLVMGWWQLGRYNDQRQQAVAAAARAAAAAAPVPLDRVVSADAAIPAAKVGTKVAVTGRYAAAEQFYVRRPLGGRAGYWVVTPLRVGRSAILVVRGWLHALPTTPPTVPPGAVTVTGWLRPPEPLPGPPRSPAADRVVAAISTAALVSRVPFDLYSGYVVLAAQRPPLAGLAVVPQPVPQVSGGTGWRNLAYASQWLIFAAFVMFMWWRVVRDARVA